MISALSSASTLNSGLSTTISFDEGRRNAEIGFSADAKPLGKTTCNFGAIGLYLPRINRQKKYVRWYMAQLEDVAPFSEAIRKNPISQKSVYTSNAVSRSRCVNGSSKHAASGMKHAFIACGSIGQKSSVIISKCSTTAEEGDNLSNHSVDFEQYECTIPRNSPWAVLGVISGVSMFVGCASANVEGVPNVVYSEVGAVLEFGVQLLYLGALLSLLGIGSFLVVRQVLIRRELENAAKDLQERVRKGEANSLEYFDLGAVMLRKKFYALAVRYLEQALQNWDGDDQDIAQVFNALGYGYVNDGNVDKGIAQFEKAVKVQPGYVVAWNNLGDAYEKKKNLRAALKAYDQALAFDPNNKAARSCADAIRTRVERLEGVPVNSDKL